MDFKKYINLISAPLLFAIGYKPTVVYDVDGNQMITMILRDEIRHIKGLHRSIEFNIFSPSKTNHILTMKKAAEWMEIYSRTLADKTNGKRLTEKLVEDLNERIDGNNTDNYEELINEFFEDIRKNSCNKIEENIGVGIANLMLIEIKSKNKTSSAENFKDLEMKYSGEATNYINDLSRGEIAQYYLGKEK